MKKLITILFFFTFSLYGQIINPVMPVSKGQYPVASSDLQHDNQKVSDIVNGGGNVGEYWEGRIEGKKYVSALLPDNTGTIKFDVEIPNNPGLYGEEAGKTYTYCAVIIYPTTSENSRTDYTLPGNFVLPKMQKNGEEPIFNINPGKLPLIIYSHGKGSHPIGALSNMEYFASHGYAVAALFYADKRYTEFSFANITNAQDIATRPLAASKLIDFLSEHDYYKNNIDFNKIAAVGNSYGGATNIALFGGKLMGITPPAYKPDRALHTDDRIVCAAGIVPYLGGNVLAGIETPFFGVAHSGVVNVKKPFLALCGSEDDVAPYEYTKTALQKMKGDKYLVKFDGLGHSLSEDSQNDYLTWIKIFLGKYITGNPLDTSSFHSVSNIHQGANDSFIPLKAPVKPIISSPETDFKVAGESVELIWKLKNDVSFYKVHISDKEDFSNLIVDENIPNKKYTYSNFDENKYYYWRIKGVNNIGESEYSETRRFYKGTITSVETEIPGEFTLSQNYPNPFNPSTTIEFSTNKNALIEIDLYNILGEKIKTIYKKETNRGQHKISFRAGGLSSGIYFYSMRAGDFIEIKKMSILK